MIDKNVIICGVVKNVQSSIHLNMNLSIKTGEKFKSYKIIVYENNSSDNTKAELNKYKNQKNIKIISEDIPDLNLRKNNKIWAYTEITGSDHPCRCELISNARNKLIDEINKEENNHYDYVIIIDLDSRGWEINGILDCFNRKEKWDAIFANSIYYYDYFALRKDGFLYGPDIIGETFWHNLPKTQYATSELIPVYSAFNGIGIYKKDIFKKYRYDFYVNDDVKQFYRNLLETTCINKKTLNQIKSPCSKFPKGYKDEESDIFWKSNSGYDGPVICEHIPLNLALYNAKYKLYINPLMIYHR